MPDTALFRVYRDLIALRKQNLRLLVDGKLTWLLTDDKRGLLVYDRVLGTSAPSLPSTSRPHRMRCQWWRREGTGWLSRWVDR